MWQKHDKVLLHVVGISNFETNYYLHEVFIITQNPG